MLLICFAQSCFFPDSPFVEAMPRDYLREVDFHISDREVMKFTVDGSWTVARLRKELFQLVFGVPPVKKQHKENLILYTYVADMDDGTRSEEELTTEKCLRSEDDRKHCKTVLFPRHMLRFKHITYRLNSPPVSSDESSSDDSYEVSLSIGYSSMIDHAKRAGDDVKGYRVFFSDDDLMVVSFDGSYTVARGTDAIMEWMRTHNFILLGKGDANEECSSTIHDTNSSARSVNDDALSDASGGSESDDEWAECSRQDLENEIEEEDILNNKENFPADAKVCIVRVLKNKQDRRGFCLWMDVGNSDVEDLLMKLEDKGVIGDADDFYTCFNGGRVIPTTALHAFFDDTKGYITFTLRVKKLKGGGVHQSLKKKKEEREKRFRLLRSKMTEATQSVGTATAGIDNDLFKRCEKVVSDLQSGATPATLAEMVSKFDTDTIKAFYEATDDGDLLFQEREVPKIAHCFIPVLNELNACAEKCDALKTSILETFTYIYALSCVSESNRYTHSMVYDLVESRQKEIEEKAKKEDEIEAEVQRRMARLNVSSEADAEMK